jgi:alkylation response protein AidB-like acyl-CoA dehydrogenase
LEFLLTEEQTMIVDMVRRFVRDEILPLEMTMDPDADEVAPEVLTKLADKTKAMGLYGLDTPPEWWA